MAVSIPLVEADIRRRPDTDQNMSFPGYILWVILVAAATFFIAGLGAIVYVYITFYRLVDRRNHHFARQHSLYRNVLRVLREYGEETTNDKVLAMADRADAALNDAVMREPDRNPWVWAVIVPILTLGIGGLYTYWFLMTDYRRHSVRQTELSDTIGEALRAATGKSVSVVDQSLVPERNFWIYLLVTVVTFGLFGIYWLYCLFNDPNKHFVQQAFAEDQIVAHLRALA